MTASVKQESNPSSPTLSSSPELCDDDDDEHASEHAQQ